MSPEHRDAPGGFPAETIDFLAALRENNSKDWFDAHRTDYERWYLQPAKAFVEAAGRQLQRIVPGIQAEPRVLGSIFRINRDTRFSSDKRPYKDHLDLWFWEGDRKQAVSGFFMRLSPEFIGVGAGCHGFGPDRLQTYRSAVTDARSGPGLLTIAEELRASGYELGGTRYKRLPPGFEAADPVLASLLKHDALYVHREEPVERATEGGLMEACVVHWRALAGLHRWLVDEVQLRPES